MNRTAFRIAASSAILALTMVSTTTQSVAMRRIGPAVEADSRTDRQAARLHEQARRAIHDGQLTQAQSAMEEAVALSPRDAGYRLLLADIYLKNGRFESARDTFADVLELDPSNVRAGLSLALTQIGLGRPQAALAQLDLLEGRAAPVDLGLAYALAGMPERGIEILEPAARGFGVTPRLRQNLALSYALAGDWQRARTIAAQDVSPGDLPARLQQWAAMARPEAGAARVASLLGVTPVQDPGQPVRLALADPAPAFAEAEPAPVPIFADAPAPVVAYGEAPAAPAVPNFDVRDSDWGVASAPEALPSAPVSFAEAAPPPADAPSYYLPPEPAAPEPADEAEIRYAAAAQTLTRPSPTLVRASAALPAAPAFRRAAPPRAQVASGNSPFVVQLGAFSNEANAERAWVEAERRFGLGDRQPLTTTFDHQGRTLHRVSIAGFAGRTDAARLCGQIRASGGACFVRANAGDASVRWAARYSRDRDDA
jgi:Flp pilus assembly protein TadD